jgi:hypothetical protein
VKRTTPKRKGCSIAEKNQTQGIIDTKKKEDHVQNFLLKIYDWMVWIIILFMKIEITANILLVQKKL